MIYCTPSECATFEPTVNFFFIYQEKAQTLRSQSHRRNLRTIIVSSLTRLAPIVR
ncbi:unnamed protein product, partial [Nesidiocoris tenuis]